MYLAVLKKIRVVTLCVEFMTASSPEKRFCRRNCIAGATPEPQSSQTARPP
jgi:hypothetical protein